LCPPFAHQSSAAAVQVAIGAAAELEIPGAELFLLIFCREDQRVPAAAKLQPANRLSPDPAAPPVAGVGRSRSQPVEVIAAEMLGLDARLPRRFVVAIAGPNPSCARLRIGLVGGVGALEGGGVAAVIFAAVIDVTAGGAQVEVAEPSGSPEAGGQVVEAIEVAVAAS
jgi:hypothetical protein